MENQWYVRIRGLILGPFSVEKLQEMANRGEFSRVHEVSLDGLSWERASSHPELFPIVLVPKPSAVTDLPTASPASPAASPPAESPTPPGGPSRTAPSGETPSTPAFPPTPVAAPHVPVWYYLQEGKQIGPIPETEFRSRLDTGELSPEVLVWNERLPAWCPAKNALEYLAKPTPLGPFLRGESASENLPDRLCQAALRISGWTLCLTVMYGLTAFLCLITGVIVIVLRSQTPAFIVGGVVSLMAAFICGIYGFLMYSYTLSLKNLRSNRTTAVFHKSLVELYHYFLAKGVIYILIMVFLGILAVVVLIMASVHSSASPEGVHLRSDYGISGLSENFGRRF